MNRERVAMGLVLAGLPVLIAALIVLPSLRRTDALKRRIQAAHELGREARPFVPVGREERAFLEDPGASWRSRLPVVRGDGARLAQVDRVVSEVSEAFRARGVRIAGMKALLAPVDGAFSLPAGPLRPAFPRRAATDLPEHRVGGWVLEVEVPGATGELFRALAAVGAVNALLEPAGLRWEVDPGRDKGRGRKPAARPGHHQYLLLRNYYLEPGS